MLTEETRMALEEFRVQRKEQKRLHALGVEELPEVERQHPVDTLTGSDFASLLDFSTEAPQAPDMVQTTPVGHERISLAEVLADLSHEPEEQHEMSASPSVADPACPFGIHGPEYIFRLKKTSGGWFGERCIPCALEPPDEARWHPELAENAGEGSGVPSPTLGRQRGSEGVSGGF